MKHRQSLCWILFLALLGAGCTVAEAHVAEGPGNVAALEEGGDVEQARLPLPAALADCPVTLPAEMPFSPRAPYPDAYPYAGRSWAGTEALWTALPDDGRWAQLLHGDKVFWWRDGYLGSKEPQPALWMTAEQLDGTGRVQQDPPATNAYHSDFGWAMLTGFQVPWPGCWEITGHYGEAGAAETLSFVVWVGE